MDFMACELLYLIVLMTQSMIAALKVNLSRCSDKKNSFIQESDICKYSYRHLGIFPKYLPAFLFLSPIIWDIDVV